MLFKILSKIYSYRTQEFFIRIKRVIRSKWLQPQFKNCGELTRFEKIGRIVGASHISIGNNCYFTEGFHLTAWDKQSNKSEIIIGDNCNFGAYNNITSINKIIVGNNFLSGKWVTITDNSHGESKIEMLDIHPSMRPVTSKGPVEIGNNVWVGEKVTILPGVKIGNGVIVAANSVVTKNIPSYSVVAGNPANIVKNCQKSE